MEDLQKFHDELTRYADTVTSGTPIDQLRSDVGRFERALADLEEQIVARRVQKGKENELGKLIEGLELRTKEIRDEAKILEGDQLSHEAQRIYMRAEELAEMLAKLKKKLFEDRKQELPALQKETAGLDREVAGLEDQYAQFLAGLESEDIRAMEEDRLPDPLRRILLLKRMADFYIARGSSECSSLRKRGRYFEQAMRALRDIPDEEYMTWAQGWDRRKAQDFVATVKHTKLELRERIREVHHSMSEGLVDKTSGGRDELNLVVAMRDKWKAENPDEFYKRLWTLHMFLNNEHADKRMLEKVRSLLTFISRQSPDANAEVHRYANEARRFLLRAGNGVIRRFFEERFNGLETEDDYARLGRALYDSNRPFGLLQLAVNIPRLFDLSLSTRFGRITDKRIRRKRVNEVTMHPEMETTDCPDDLPDVPPDEFDPGWLQRLAEGDLAVVRYEDQKLEEEEVGVERQMEAQEYLLDVSGSMYVNQFGHPVQRWLLRNAIFLAALNSYSVDATVKDTKEFQNLLFLRLFGDRVGDLMVVRNQAEARRFLDKYMSYHDAPLGGTDIQLALETAFADIKGAKGFHRSLKEAKVVIVTDGESELNLFDLLQAQDVKGTRIVTHVFAVENQNPGLKELSRSSGPGKAFYYFIEDAGDEQYVDLPPYGTPEEFSPVYPEPSFSSEAERARFEAEVDRRCDEIVELMRQGEDRKDDAERELREDCDTLFEQAPLGRIEEAWSPKMERKSRRVIDVLGVASEITDDYTSPGEAMALLRHVLRKRAVLKQELHDIATVPLTDESRAAVVKYQDEVYPKLNRR
ncbi:hypothetical protein HYW83_01715 [Candidatus Peregrinibacteria bacterium]|nr:hypothetical protein [Candidatus Peregrinibacteria bacterium]